MIARVLGWAGSEGPAIAWAHYRVVLGCGMWSEFWWDVDMEARIASLRSKGCAAIICPRLGAAQQM